MSNVTERAIQAIESCVVYEEPAKAVKILESMGITGYDAWLAWKAAEVSVAMFRRDFKSTR